MTQVPVSVPGYNQQAATETPTRIGRNAVGSVKEPVAELSDCVAAVLSS